jgi:hypothetical protein
MKKVKENKRKDLGVQEFTCEYCHSVFDTDEFDIENRDSMGDWSMWFGYKKTPCFVLTSDCPVCRFKTSKWIPTGEKPYWAGRAI